MRTDRRQFVKTALATSLACRLTGPRRALADSLASSNDAIQQARQVALSILRPSDRDIAHGLELHSQSLVFDSYGFAPRAAIDGQAYQQAALGGASDAELIDLREDMSMTRYATDESERREFFEAFRAAGVTCVFQNAGEEGSDPLRLLKRLARFTFATDVLSPQCSKAITPEQVVAAKKSDRLCLAFTTNGVPLRQHWESTRDELRDVRLFHQLGVQMMHLTYNRRNPLGDGCGEPNDGGVSDFGRVAIKELNRQGVIVDVAHSGWRTSLEAAKASSKPMVASHTACAALHKHYRGKPDETIQAICDTGGLIGICCIPKFLGAAGDIRAFLDHLDYAIKNFGADHVAIGTDVAYQSRNDKVERAKVGKRPDGSSPLAVSGSTWEHLWPDFKFRPADDAVQSLAWTNWPVFTIGLVQRGHSDEAIRKVLSENMLRVWRANQQTS
ncbi:MAG TPA: membrane dipeptidase [Pirellulales bacterium]|jgi:membrane dipeptidase|nr:membrane dipeptidase [Pirellulales bacterium]